MPAELNSLRSPPSSSPSEAPPHESAEAASIRESSCDQPRPILPSEPKGEDYHAKGSVDESRFTGPPKTALRETVFHLRGAKTALARHGAALTRHTMARRLIAPLLFAAGARAQSNEDAHGCGLNLNHSAWTTDAALETKATARLGKRAAPAKYVVDLDKAPEDRWAEIGTLYQNKT